MMRHRQISHCRACGGPAVYTVPADDNRERATCQRCGLIHYENPINVVGTLPVWQGQVLLCQRNIEPRKGYWTLPAGFMELGETVEAGALRETQEEAGCPVVLGPLYSVVNVVRVGQVHLFFLADMVAPEWSAGEESMDVRLFDEADIPWDDLAFNTVRVTLEHYFEDRRRGVFGTHCLTVDGSVRLPQ